MRDQTHPNERLLERASEGDRRAFASIFKRYHQRLYRYCAAIVGDPEDARDALQSTMVRVLAALPGERRTLELEPWLYRIAHNEAIEIVRRRRHTVELDSVELPGDSGPEASLESRERLRHLVADLRQLPERQRGALMMRELGGLSFEQIGEAFETSAQVVRQTVYEARVSLQDMEGGRAMPCDEVRRKLSDGDRRLIRRRDVRAHLRECARCRDFEQGISNRRNDLAAIAPLPALVAGGLLQSLIGGAVGGAAGTGAGAAAAGALSKAVGGSVVAKAVATTAVVAAIGVAAADRGALIHIVPGGGSSTSKTQSRPPTAPEAPLPDAQVGAAAGLSQSGGVADPALAPGRHARGDVQGPNRARPASVPGDGGTPKAPASPGSSAEPGSAGRGGGAANAHGANPHANPNAALKASAGKGNGRGGSKAHAPHGAPVPKPSPPSHSAHPKPEGQPKGQPANEPPPNSGAHEGDSPKTVE